ncbi:MAG: phosphoglycerate kinase [Gemmatimonadetes bacterium]|nr:phosphoglycerate kinase [Gemmatimonadota bacterium]MYH52190.1 phosphoglycerate kinase [Gemmatimonadota bacterium]MYK66093.1 phosphoglycerate kinase [Gemmatimonadota bacterium]
MAASGEGDAVSRRGTTPLTLDDLERHPLKGAAVALRADFNVPLNPSGTREPAAGGEVADRSRIERTVPTIDRLAEAGAKVVVLSHLGRPGGRPSPALTLAPVARCLADLVSGPVRFVPHTSGSEVREAVADAGPGSVTLVENTRFLPGETANDPALAADWATWADHFVLDAFGTAHRAHASTDGLPRAVRAKGGMAVVGTLIERELAVFAAVLEEPRRPFVAVLGGAKISGKIDVIEALLPRVDALLVGGAMANTFLRAMGMETGTSLVEEEKTSIAWEVMAAGAARVVLPVDCVTAGEIAAGAPTRVVDRAAIPPGEAVGDIGPVSVRLFGEYLAKAATVVWNGPMGVFEVDGFGEGTFEVARIAAAAADRGATVVVGGGDSAAAARAAGVASRISHISTGGGASLELLAGRELPGVAALSGRRSDREA